MTEARSLRETKIERARAQLVESALRLFLERGFDATTVDDIARAAEISPRTFFRYFESKEDVVLAFSDAVGEQVRLALAARPPEEPALTALRAALEEVAATFMEDRERALGINRLIQSTPALRSRQLAKQARWSPPIAAELARRMRAKPDALGPRVIVAAALAAYDVAVTQWAAANGARPLARHVDEAFSALAREVHAAEPRSSAPWPARAKPREGKS